MMFLLQFLSYGVMTWLVFMAIAFTTARYVPWWCIPIGHLVVAAIVYSQDFDWVQAEMRKPEWDGAPDLDMIFMFGVLIRVVVINTGLLPFTILGVWLARRQRRMASASAA